jgi:hypothetical protein
MPGVQELLLLLINLMQILHVVSLAMLDRRAVMIMSKDKWIA